MDFVTLILNICSECKTPSETVQMLHRLKLIDPRAVKYYLIHEYFTGLISQGLGIMDATTITSDEFNISDRQVFIVRKYMQVKAPIFV